MIKTYGINSLICATINVRGLNENEKRRRLFFWLESKSFDVIFLQETFCTDNFVSIFNSGWKGKICHATTNSKHSRGVSILFTHKRKVEIVNHFCFENGRVLLVNANVDDESYTFVSVYAPNEHKHRREFFTSIKHCIVQNSLNED